MSKESRRESRRLRQLELLKNFTDDFYQEKQVDGKWLVKHQDGVTGNWVVAEYSQESFQRYKEYADNGQRFKYLLEKE